MTREQLEKQLGKKVKIQFADGDIINGYLRKNCTKCQKQCEVVDLNYIDNIMLKTLESKRKSGEISIIINNINKSEEK